MIAFIGLGNVGDQYKSTKHNGAVTKKIKENKTTKIRFKVDLIARNCQYEVEVEEALTKVSWKPSTRPPVITINMAPRGK